MVEGNVIVVMIEVGSHRRVGRIAYGNLGTKRSVTVLLDILAELEDRSPEEDQKRGADAELLRVEVEESTTNENRERG